MALRARYQSIVQNVVQIRQNMKLPEKYKGTVVEKWAKYWEALVNDYAEVFRDTVKEAREKKLKTLAYLTGGAGFAFAFSQNPTENAFRSRLIEYQNLFGLVGTPVRNPQADAHLKRIENAFNHNTLRRFSLGICSIIWLDNYDDALGLYKAKCEYLKPQILNFHKRIIDVGFLNRFWILDKKMEDYDVNPNEWLDFTDSDYEYKSKIRNVFTHSW